jgi:hypothetical protein
MKKKKETSLLENYLVAVLIYLRLIILEIYYFKMIFKQLEIIFKKREAKEHREMQNKY